MRSHFLHDTSWLAYVTQNKIVVLLICEPYKMAYYLKNFQKLDICYTFKKYCVLNSWTTSNFWKSHCYHILDILKKHFMKKRSESQGITPLMAKNQQIRRFLWFLQFSPEFIPNFCMLKLFWKLVKLFLISWQEQYSNYLDKKLNSWRRNYWILIQYDTCSIEFLTVAFLVAQ